MTHNRPLTPEERRRAEEIRETCRKAGEAAARYRERVAQAAAESIRRIEAARLKAKRPLKQAASE